MRVAIHQPNFSPWLGFFHKVSLVETFVVFDHVQAPTGKSWLSRNRLAIGGDPQWITVPIRRSGRSFQRISDVEIFRESNEISKLLRTIEQSYRRQPFFDAVFPILRDSLNGPDIRLAQLNFALISSVCDLLGISVKWRFSSEVVRANPSLDRLRGNALVVALCREVGATQYLSGTGCLDFIQPSEFLLADIDFRFQRFREPVLELDDSHSLSQGLSIFDWLFRIGPVQTARLLGVGPTASQQRAYLEV